MSEKPALVVFSDDWGRHPSSCQHLVKHLLPRYDVFWVNTIGTRPVRFDWYTAKRGFGKLIEWSKPKPVDDPIWSSAFRRSSEPAEAGTPTPTVLKPLMWPSFSSRWARSLNRKLLCRCLRKAIGNRKPIVLTTIPVVADLIGALPAERWVYYCVDDFSTWPGLDGDTLRDMEAELLQRVDDVVAVSESLKERLKKLGRESTLLTHGVDIEFWNGDGGNQNSDGTPHRLASSPPPPQGGRFPLPFDRPLILFWGLIDARLDASWIAALSQSMTEGTILLVGPEQNPSPELATINRVHRLGPKSIDELPGIAKQASVLIMPYADMAATRAMQPLKLKEYLATGKPVVVSKLPSTEPWRDAADVASSAEEFTAAVMKRIAEGVDPSQLAAREKRACESWAAKAHELELVWCGATA